jgi:fused signal recognition particle receptor
MFDSLKKKLSGWLGKPEEKITKKKSSKKATKKKSAPKTKTSSKKEKESKKEISPPTKFNPGTLNSEPDITELKKQAEKITKNVEAPDDTKQDLQNNDEEKETSFFSKLAKSFTTKTLTGDQFDQIFMELELILLENNVALEVVDKIQERLKEDLIGIEIKKDNIQSTIIQSLKESILSVLHEPEDLIQTIKKKQKLNPEPYVIIFFGINGAGKTTSLAKLAHKLESQGLSCVLAAGDTFRAASIEQLHSHGEKLNIPVIASDYNSDPASVAFDAIAHAKKNKKNVVLIDTAGRMYTKSDLMREMEKIIRISEPDLKIFVGESITGNDATEQARTFNESVNIDGIILTKADVDEKAGTILSVSHITNKPILFLGTGQEYSDLTNFKKSMVLKNLGLD